MELVAVDARMIALVGYDSKAQELEVRFASGWTYCSTNVPREVYDALLAAASKGQYMRAYVLDIFPCYAVLRRRW